MIKCILLTIYLLLSNDFQSFKGPAVTHTTYKASTLLVRQVSTPSIKIEVSNKDSQIPNILQLLAILVGFII